MKSKYTLSALVFLAAVIIGAVANWSSAKINWLVHNRTNLDREQAAVTTEVALNQSQPPVTWTVPEGVSLSPAPSARLDAPPEEIMVTFPKSLQFGSLNIDYDGTNLTRLGDEFTVKGKSVVFPLPAAATSGIYSVQYKGCFSDSVDDCISGTFGFTVK